MKRRLRVAVIGLLVGLFPAPTSAGDLEDLAREFWTWRATEQPISGDDIPRLGRPAGWAPDWSRSTVEKHRQTLADFEGRWKRIDPSAWPVPQQVDYRLMGSALARVRWELEVLRSWQRNPTFYVEQTLGAVFDRLLQPPPFDKTRCDDILRRIANIPRIVENANANLARPAAPFARLAVSQLTTVRERFSSAISELKPHLTPASAAQIDAPAEKAIEALESYRAWLERQLPALPEETAVGREAYVFFLKNVALIPYTPEDMFRMSRQELERAVAFENYEDHRNQGLPALPLFPSQAAQIAREERDEVAVRQFLEVRGILSVPSWMKHYRYLPLPSYLEPLRGLGVTDDLTGPERLQGNATSYIRTPSPELGYFYLAMARDPRTLIVHEGVPGHYFQLTLSWAHEDPVRRHYYDSGANEGIGFYAEEMMLQAGLFDDRPRTREIIYNFMRLRALRVEVDVKLALALFTIDEAARYLKENVPMDAETARDEAESFASGPGQAITYQIGKLQIVGFLADARRLKGESFSLRDFHDFLYRNGNVPIALQRWEYLGLKDQLESLERIR